MSSFVVNGDGGGDFELHPPSVVAARCVKIIDLGTVQTEWKGQKKSSKKLLITFQSESKHTTGQFEGEPFQVQQKFTASIGEKANLRKFLEAWRGRAFTEAELHGFDMKNVIGKGCMLNIVHNTVGTKTYANISSVMPLPGSMKAPDAVGDLIFLSLNPESFDQSVYEKLSDRMREQIAETPEFKALGAPQAQPDLAEDDIPF